MENKMNNSGIVNNDCSGFMGMYHGTTLTTADLAKMLDSSITASYTYSPTVLHLAHNPAPVELQVNYTIKDELARTDPAEVERLIRYELARKLANKMIEEDLIKILCDHDPELMEYKYRASVKFVQE